MGQLLCYDLLPGLELPHGTHSNCCGALCKVPNAHLHLPHGGIPYQRKIVILTPGLILLFEHKEH